MKLEKTVCDIVEKSWGKEEIIYNSDDYESHGYCGKILRFNKGAEFSTHLHLRKHETWLVFEGCLNLTYIDTIDASRHEMVLYQGDVISIPQMVPHRLKALENSAVFEVSTIHYDSDSYRVEKGDSQR